MSVTGFLTPLEPVARRPRRRASRPRSRRCRRKFDASNLTVEQFEATSTDGTKVPYFVVHPKDMKLDGSTPTILYAYGGFQVSETPYYSATIGKLWLEHGGVYVLANIRGGGEFGPAWHEAGLKTKRQRHLRRLRRGRQGPDRRKGSPARALGIKGGSNGGLLMGVEFTQHPELWNAVDIQVPLLDMMRFEQIAAGSSWVGEYGSVSVPAERAFLATISPYQNLKAACTIRSRWSGPRPRTTASARSTRASSPPSSLRYASAVSLSTRSSRAATAPAPRSRRNRR